MAHSSIQPVILKQATQALRMQDRSAAVLRPYRQRHILLFLALLGNLHPPLLTRRTLSSRSMRTSLSASLLLAALLAAGVARPAAAQAQKTPGTAPSVEAEASSEGQGGSGLQMYFAASSEAGQPNQLPLPDAQLPPQLPTPALCRFLLCLCSAAAGTSPLCCVADSTIELQAKVPPHLPGCSLQLSPPLPSTRLARAAAVYTQKTFATPSELPLHHIKLPDGFKITLYTDQSGKFRWHATMPSGGATSFAAVERASPAGLAQFRIACGAMVRNTPCSALQLACCTPPPSANLSSSPRPLHGAVWRLKPKVGWV